MPNLRTLQKLSRPNYARTELSTRRYRSPPLYGGDERDRTVDLRLAKPALSQLSYIPRKPLGTLWFRAG